MPMVPAWHPRPPFEQPGHRHHSRARRTPGSGGHGPAMHRSTSAVDIEKKPGAETEKRPTPTPAAAPASACGRASACGWASACGRFTVHRRHKNETERNIVGAGQAPCRATPHETERSRKLPMKRWTLYCRAPWGFRGCVPPDRSACAPESPVIHALFVRGVVGGISPQGIHLVSWHPDQDNFRSATPKGLTWPNLRLKTVTPKKN